MLEADLTNRVPAHSQAFSSIRQVKVTRDWGEVTGPKRDPLYKMLF